MCPGSHLVSSAVMFENPSERQSGRFGILVHTTLEIKDTQADETANLRDPGLFLVRCFCAALPWDHLSVKRRGRRCDVFVGLAISAHDYYFFQQGLQIKWQNMLVISLQNDKYKRFVIWLRCVKLVGLKFWLGLSKQTSWLGMRKYQWVWVIITTSLRLGVHRQHG